MVSPHESAIHKEIEMRILYATDGSECALAGARLLATLPLGRQCHLSLLAVLPEQGSVDATVLLGPALQLLRDTSAAIHTQIRWGAADEAILSVLAAQPADLVVMGSRGLSGLSHLLLGSVSEHVARHAPCPVLLARPLAGDLRAAVLGWDGSECSTRATEWLSKFPLPRACTVHGVTAFPDGPAAALSHRGTTSPPRGRPAERPRPETGMTPTSHPYGTVGLPADRRVETHVEIGEPAQALLNVAKQCQADLIVVGSHGRSGIGRLLLGSVSESVLRHAPCSVLVVK
jgi:nucleotide-binding universal stress UspA family protein